MATIKSVEERQKELLKASEESMNKAIADNETLYGKQKATTTELYQGQISDTEKAYEDQYRENAVQKLINERQVAESMANMGLTDSGLNRTQQTAVQLSYANNKANIDRQRQSQVDALAREMTSQLASIEQNRLAGNSSIRSTYEKNAWDNAVSAYNTDVEAETARYKADQERLAKEYESDNEYNLKMAELKAKNSYIIPAANSLLNMDYEGSLSSKGVTCYRITKNNETYVRYVDSNSGKQVELPLGQSPYTGKTNPNIKYGAFGNGYQPDNVGKNKKLSAAKLKIDFNGHKKGETAEYSQYGQEQTIWKNGDNYYIWDRKTNDYKNVTEKVKNIVE